MGLARDIINVSRHSEIRFVKQAGIFFKNPNPDVVANLSFLFGRLRGAEARQRAHRLLQATRDDFQARLEAADAAGAGQAEIRGRLFTLRTLFVSLIYLGDEKASDDYIALLLDDPR
jgi:hypothetical protein